jgi:hypothetical protein
MVVSEFQTLGLGVGEPGAVTVPDDIYTHGHHESVSGRTGGGTLRTRLGTSCQALARGFADRADLAALTAAWTAWAEDEDGWFAVLHGEILERVT